MKFDKKVFVINGSAGVGKDTFCEFVGEFVPTVVVSSVDPIKALMREMGWNGEKTEKDRKFMSDLKDLTTQYNDFPMNCLREKVKFFYSDNNKMHRVMFLHIREPQEIQKAVDEFNARTILVRNSNVEHLTSNHADANVANYKYDIYINNSGTLENLKDIAEWFCKSEKLSK